MLWNSLISALGVGATAVLVDGNPTFPSVDRVWQVTAAENVAVLGVSAGFVHACAKTDLVPMNDHDLSALRSLQVTGSPLSADGYRWVYGHVGDIWLSSMSGGTDIASVFVGGTPTLPVRVGYIQAPALGVRVEAWDDAGSPTTGKGELVVTQPMPSMPLQFWGDDGSRYHDSYFSTYPGVWRHGDYIEFSRRGILIHGRSDSTLNRNGLRLGSADIYAAVETLPEVAEALVIGAELGTEYYMPLFVETLRRRRPRRGRGSDREVHPGQSLRPLPARRDRVHAGNPAHPHGQEAGSPGETPPAGCRARRRRGPGRSRRPRIARRVRPVRARTACHSELAGPVIRLGEALRTPRWAFPEHFSNRPLGHQ